MKQSTICVHGHDKRYDSAGAVSVPIFQSATFVHPGVGQSTGFDYSRAKNPTREALEATVTALEHGVDTCAFTSGMAAVNCLTGLFKPGDHIIMSDDVYGGTLRLFVQVTATYGVKFTAVNTSDLSSVSAAITPDTKAVFVETPTNPTMQVTDIAECAELCHNRNLLLIVDNTFLTPYLQNPLDLGADIVLHSGTKYLGGHNDTLCGFLVSKSPEVAEQIRWLAKTTGAVLAPFDCWLVIRGIKTLAVRMERQQKSAAELAGFLRTLPTVTDVFYPGLPDHLGYEISKKQARGFGAMLSFNTVNKDVALLALEKCSVIAYAESLGGVESLLTYPLTQTHADVPREQREKLGITDRFLRLSVGIEDVEDLKADLAQALRA
ncbi:MAG: PLP-dependent aspartate aminotransferase family protein [Oscillospiraceae bacterium]|jgi:cystathionine gamma-synthase|nr:PLP-dependent aspartate aminotransferase family protein [Oscillospiraceae bacterium]